MTFELGAAGLSQEAVVAQGKQQRIAIAQAHANWQRGLVRYRRRSMAMHGIGYTLALLLMTAGSGQITVMTIPAGLAIGAGLTWIMLVYQIPCTFGRRCLGPTRHRWRRTAVGDWLVDTSKRWWSACHRAVDAASLRRLWLDLSRDPDRLAR